MMNRWKLLGAMVFAILAIAAVVYQVNPYTPGLTAGTQVSESGSVVTLIESSLIHPVHADNLVNKGDPVLLANEGVSGVALTDAATAGDYIAIGRYGIWNLSITNTVNVPMALGDVVYISPTAAALSDTPGTTGFPFGILLSAIATSNTAVVRPVLLKDGASSAVANLIAGGDVTAGDDVGVGDDLVVGDDASVTGDLGVGGTFQVTGTSTLGPITLGGGSLLKGVRVTSTTMVGTAGTTANVTVSDLTPTTGYVWGQVRKGSSTITGGQIMANPETGLADLRLDATSSTAANVTVDVFALIK